MTEYVLKSEGKFEGGEVVVSLPLSMLSMMGGAASVSALTDMLSGHKAAMEADVGSYFPDAAVVWSDLTIEIMEAPEADPASDAARDGAAAGAEFKRKLAAGEL